jgi:hypothetical protein
MTPPVASWLFVQGKTGQDIRSYQPAEPILKILLVLHVNINITSFQYQKVKVFSSFAKRGKMGAHRLQNKAKYWHFLKFTSNKFRWLQA